MRPKESKIPRYEKEMILSKNCTKIQLDNQLRVCRAFAETQISLIEKDIRDGSVNSVP